MVYFNGILGDWDGLSGLSIVLLKASLWCNMWLCKHETFMKYNCLFYSQNATKDI